MLCLAVCLLDAHADPLHSFIQSSLAWVLTYSRHVWPQPHWHCPWRDANGSHAFPWGSRILLHLNCCSKKNWNLWRDYGLFCHLARDKCICVICIFFLEPDENNGIHETFFFSFPIAILCVCHSFSATEVTILHFKKLNFGLQFLLEFDISLISFPF